ncbi:tyrosine-protein phosphatase non-receptor type substrate 1-like [Salminus brasiliensis]|uniref:tyrosine-protein phosphatase non-receptor type substrate 1-like n=1 Tax=Salminus brasiliensis TaxID=930266 RepID=UPI003B82F050
MAPSPLHTLILLCLCSDSISGASVSDGDSNQLVTVSVGQTATIHCKPPSMSQDGVYMYKQLFKQEEVAYFYKDGTFTPKGRFLARLDTNRVIENFAVSIINVTVWDTGAFYCVFNKEDTNSPGMQKTLLVVSGKQKDCSEDKKNSEASTLLLIIMCVAAAFLMLLITVILLLAIPKIKHCCEHGQFTPPHQSGDGVYEEMRGRRPNANTANILINPAYQTSRHTRTHVVD